MERTWRLALSTFKGATAINLSSLVFLSPTMFALILTSYMRSSPPDMPGDLTCGGVDLACQRALVAR
jgi:hypothetical protein